MSFCTTITEANCVDAIQKPAHENYGTVSSLLEVEVKGESTASHGEINLNLLQPAFLAFALISGEVQQQIFIYESFHSLNTSPSL